jgi:hypothetical protein
MAVWTGVRKWVHIRLSGHGAFILAWSYFDDALGIVEACVVLHSGVVLGSSMADGSAVFAWLRRFGGIVSHWVFSFVAVAPHFLHLLTPITIPQPPTPISH